MAIKKKLKKIKASAKKATKKTVKKKPLKKASTQPKKKTALKKTKEPIIGIVTHYFPKVRAGVIKLKASLAIGDTVKIKGHTTDFTQKIISMQIDRVAVNAAKKGQEIGLLVDSRVREQDVVYKA